MKISVQNSKSARGYGQYFFTWAANFLKFIWNDKSVGVADGKSEYEKAIKQFAKWMLRFMMYVISIMLAK